MKVIRYKLLLMVCFVALVFGCDTTLDPSEWDEHWNIEQVCYTVKDQSTNLPIQGASITLIQYNHSDCSTCPVDLNLVTNTNGGVCKNLTVGWTCDSAVISADGYVSQMFTSKPPSTIFMVPSGN